MRRKKRIWLWVLVIVLLAAAGLAVWQWKNIRALQLAVSMDADTLEAEMQKNNLALDTILEEYDLPAEISVSNEDLDRLQSGEVTVEELAGQMIGQSTMAEGTNGTTQQSSGPSSSSSSAEGAAAAEPESAPKDNSAAISRQIASLYVLKASFVSRLDAIVQSADSEFHALPQSEWNQSNKTRIAQSKLSELSALEKECDGKVAEIVTELRRLLRESGRDESVADQAQEIYENEKSLKKAYYIRELNG